jgi:hypothetical protein
LNRVKQWIHDGDGYVTMERSDGDAIGRIDRGEIVSFVTNLARKEADLLKVSTLQ